MALSPGLHNPVHGASKGVLGILRPALNYPQNLRFANTLNIPSLIKYFYI
jgi:hypothetical protein